MILILHLIGMVIGTFGFGMVYQDYKSKRMPRSLTIPFMVIFAGATAVLIFNIFAAVL